MAEEELKDRRPASLLAAAATTYGTNFIAAVLSLANVYIVARALGPVGRGEVAFVMAIPLMVFQVASLSLQESNANVGGSQPDLRPSLVTNSFLAAAILGTIGALAIVLLVELIPSVGGDVDRTLLWLGLTSIPVLLLKIYLSLLLQSDYHFTLTNLAWVSGPITTATVNGTLTVLGVITVDLAVAVWIAGQVLGMAPLIWGVRRHFGFGRVDIGLLRTALRFGLKTHVGRFLAVGTYRADQWLLGAVAGSRELGLYSVAFAWAEMLFYLPGVIVLLQRPDLVRAGPREAAELTARVFRRALFLAAGAAVLLLVAAPFLCVTVFGEEFRDSVVNLRVLALAAPGIVASQLLANALISQRRPLIASIATAIGFAVMLGLDILLIPSLGGLGAAIATSSAFTVGGLASVLIFKRVFRVSLREFVPRADDLAWYLRKMRTVRDAAQAALRSRG